MLFPGLSTGYLDRCTLAVLDILHGNAWLRDNFGGLELAGVADATPATATLNGTATSWATGDDSLAEGTRLMLGSQLATVESVASDTSLELAMAHVLGLSSATISKAARGFRVDRLVQLPPPIALPYYLVSAGVLPAFESAIGRFAVQPSIVISFVYEASRHPLDDTSASWAGLAQLVLSLFEGSGANQRLCVDRFRGESLSRKLISAAPGDALLETPAGGFIPAPAVQLTFEGVDPIAAVDDITQDW